MRIDEHFLYPLFINTVWATSKVVTLIKITGVCFDMVFSNR